MLLSRTVGGDGPITKLMAANGTCLALAASTVALVAACGQTSPVLVNADLDPAMASCTTFVEQNRAMCPEVDMACPGPAAAQCVLSTGADAFQSLCNVESGADICDGDRPSRDYEHYCAVQHCFGDDFETCMARGESQCAQRPSNLCDEIRALAGHCPAFGYACEQRPRHQSECFRDLLRSLEDPCLPFYRLPICGAGGTVSSYGDANCQLQACFELSYYQDCYDASDTLCDHVTP